MPRVEIHAQMVSQIQCSSRWAFADLVSAAAGRMAVACALAMGRILIAEETLVHIQDRFVVESWGAVELRGKQQLINVYQVVGHQRDASTSNTE